MLVPYISFPITKAQYNYLIPVPGMRKKLLRRVSRWGDMYSFIGTYEDYKDILIRCQYLDY